MLRAVHEDKEAIEKLNEEAGCFVLLTNVPLLMKKRSGDPEDLQGAGWH
jgi:hypothetical protein